MQDQSIKKYDQKQYHNNFLQKNKEKIKEKHTCEICYGSYTYFNKYNHQLTQRHLNMLNRINNQNNR
jgi:hypothetical protein